MLKFIRNLINQPIYSAFDLLIAFVALGHADALAPAESGFFIHLIIFCIVALIGIFLKHLFIAFIDARLKARAQKDYMKRPEE